MITDFIKNKLTTTSSKIKKISHEKQILTTTTSRSILVIKVTKIDINKKNKPTRSEWIFGHVLKEKASMNIYKRKIIVGNEN